MVRGFWVECNVGSTRFGEHFDHIVYGFNHEMDVDFGSDIVFSEGLADEGADGEIGDIVVVHNIEVDDICTCIKDRTDFITQAGKVGR